MTPRDAVDMLVPEMGVRYPYIPDCVDYDVWDTVREFENRPWPKDMDPTGTKKGGGDCDGQTLWCLVRAQLMATGQYYFIEGTVQHGAYGHAWVLVYHGGAQLWADPTWGELCHAPGWYDGRDVIRVYHMDGEIMGKPL